MIVVDFVVIILFIILFQFFINIKIVYIPNQKSNDYKETALQYYLTDDKWINVSTVIMK